MDPREVWQLIERADELTKYAGNRDAAEARRRARETLQEASRGAASVEDAAARAALSAQIDRRLADLEIAEPREDA